VRPFKECHRRTGPVKPSGTRQKRPASPRLVDPEIKARLIGLGATALVLSPGDLGKLMAADIEKWAKVVKAANLKPE
jgi:hypothetical protein